jgi:hypothetical protein
MNGILEWTEYPWQNPTLVKKKSKSLSKVSTSTSKGPFFLQLPCVIESFLVFSIYLLYY